MNEALATIKEDGTMAELYETWFGGRAAADRCSTGRTELTDD